MLTLSQLEQYLSKAAWILKGPVDAADFKVYIFPLLFFKRISDVYDEEYKDIPGFAKVVSNEKILENGATLNISQYVSRLEVKDETPKQSLEELLNVWESNRKKLYTEIMNLI
ncbi:MAG: type I restriction-modification system subunit M N-terminal domain-containing protein [Bacteroidales bacterium]|nr:type I restriction-modification system subunit M N-terminal domain-containing protein [Bacteroidales bacterium]